jgi:hypothetical protein
MYATDFTNVDRDFILSPLRTEQPLVQSTALLATNGMYFSTTVFVETVPVHLERGWVVCFFDNQ